MTDSQPSTVEAVGRKRRPGWGAALAGATIAAVAGFLLGFLVFEDDENGERPAAGRPALVERIAAHPGDYTGRSVLVSGVVKEILSPRVFTIARQGLAGPKVLIVAPTPVAAPTAGSALRPILEGDVVQVTGTVRRFDPAKYQRATGVDLKADAYSFPGTGLNGRVGQPAIRATLVTFSGTTTPVVQVRTVKEITQHPRDFYGNIVSVGGRVTAVLPSGAFVIDGALLTLTADLTTARPRKGQRVRIVGPLRPFDPDQRRVGAKSLPGDELFGRFASRPALVAQAIEVQP